MICLDTNVVIALMKGNPLQVRLRFAQAIAARETVMLSALVLFELEFGVAKSERLAIFLRGAVSVIPFESEDAAVAGEVRAALERKGTPIGPYDLLIGAQALRHGATLVTGNLKEFRRIKGLRCVDWGKV
jgi:tRNA(fMet)-specific endonuclease VapC